MPLPQKSHDAIAKIRERRFIICSMRFDSKYIGTALLACPELPTDAKSVLFFPRRMEQTIATISALMQSPDSLC